MISFNLDFSSEKCALVCSNFGISSRHKNIFNLNDLDPNNLGFDINNGITLITGHSGVGKSTIGEVFRERYSFFDIKDIIISDVNSPIIDIIDADFKDSIYFLNIAGLSEPYLYLTSYKNLSSGQKFRFMIALMISKGVKKIYCDEFCSDLDRSTAYFLSYNLRRFSTKLGVSFIFISNDKNIKDYLFPDNYLSFDLYSNISINKSVDLIENPFKKHLVVKEASYEDYCLLEKYHYFPSAEESINLSYNAKYYTLEYKEDVVGGLIIRDPYSNEEENDSLLNINNKIKVLYRVILHPLVRGCGILRFF
ncbi:ABC transporter [Glaesserella parasuis]|uniref:ABC transporter n=1 Tax=Glaesserella parasuis TaxID=738 RepID=UPI0024364269|nr:ABC transporter [Glaesserella parasuis]MDG6828940.1 ABC transporter [Glaesserella parasuis]MDO9927138.1 ABC transporter [Glaesserella parasuis]MDO9931684.1 ABC transporter [Glaesserella parasuis]MDO9982689.1 ABC transporter [Glaesserella parasuis]MDP0129249.1 ABC transporter [Glaesserella parasuis]